MKSATSSILCLFVCSQGFSVFKSISHFFLSFFPLACSYLCIRNSF
jgi:hypothetical protein